MARFTASSLAALWLALAVCAPAGAALVDGVNAIRERGCENRPGAGHALRASRELQQVAREWAQGGPLREAIARTDYRIINSSSMHVAGARTEPALLELLARNYCANIVDPQFTEIGIFESGEHVWLVLATPFTAPGTGEAQQVARRALELVNAARGTPRKCGSTSHAAVGPLRLSSVLTGVALAHARDMAQHDFFDHRGSDGSHPAQRVTRAGYEWNAVGENIAAGPADAETVVRGWLASPHHCTNIMGPQFTEMGLAYFVERKSESGIYWAQVFARPRRE